MADNVTLNAGTGGDVVAADDIGPGVKHQRVKVEYGADGSATDVAPANPIPAGHHRNTAAVRVVNGTVTIAAADGTAEKDGPTFTAPGAEAGLGDRIGVWVRNPSNHELEVRLRHRVTDPNGGATRWGVLSTVSGAAVATITNTAVEPDGVLVWFDGGLVTYDGSSPDAKLTIRAVAAVDATYTVSVCAWMRN